MNAMLLSGAAASLMLAGCITGPDHSHMTSHEACMAKMRSQADAAADQQVMPGDKDMMKKCPMMQGGHDRSGGSSEPHDHGGEAMHRQ